MATADSTNTKLLPTFSNIKPFEQLAVQLRAEGKSYEEVTNTINAEFELAYKSPSLRQWFMVGGRLEQAFMEYNEAMADQSIKVAKTKLKAAQTQLADWLIELASPGHESNVRISAIRAGLNKFIPDKQIVMTAEPDDELPDEIANAAAKVLHGSEPVDEPQQSQSADTSAGPTGDQAISS